MSTQYHSAKTQQYLENALAQLRLDNPDKTFVLDSGAVWLRHNGKDYGIYSATILDERVVYCLGKDNTTPLHRDSPTEATA